MFEELSSSLRRDIAPVGALEELLVDELIMLTWRRRRVLRYETGVISQHLGSIVQSFDQINNQLDQLADQTKHIDRELSALDEKDPLAARPELWTRVFEVAEGQYGVPIKELLGLEDCWDPYDTYSREEIQQVIEAACQRGEISAGEFWTAFQVKIQLEKILLTPGPTRLHLTLEQKLQLIGLPHHTTLEKIQRYEAHLSRQLYPCSPRTPTAAGGPPRSAASRSGGSRCRHRRRSYWIVVLAVYRTIEEGMRRWLNWIRRPPIRLRIESQFI